MALGQGGLTSRAVRHQIVCLHTALQNAVKMGILVRNPVDAVIISRVERHEIRAMNESGIHGFLEMARLEGFEPTTPGSEVC